MDGKDKWTLNSSSTGSSDLSKYEFLGLLMGCCIRTGAHLTLDLPSFVWKQLAHQVIIPEDLSEVDTGFWNLLKFMLTSEEKIYTDTIEEAYSVPMTDGSH